MGKLAEYLKSEAGAIQTTKESRRAAFEEWTTALNALFAQLRGWLSECDPDRLLDAEVQMIPGKDPAFSDHTVPALRVALINRTVTAVPRGRYVTATVRPPGVDKPVRATGLVELSEDAGRRYYLFRLPDGQWYIQPEPTNPREIENRVEPLNRDRFESAVWALLQ